MKKHSPLKPVNINVVKEREEFGGKEESGEELQFNSARASPCLYYKMQTPQHGLMTLHGHPQLFNFSPEKAPLFLAAQACFHFFQHARHVPASESRHSLFFPARAGSFPPFESQFKCHLPWEVILDHLSSTDLPLPVTFYLITLECSPSLHFALAKTILFMSLPSFC